MFKATRRRPAGHARLNIAVGCWDESIERHLRRVVKDAVRQGCAVAVRILAAPPHSSRFSVRE